MSQQHKDNISKSLTGRKMSRQHKDNITKSTGMKKLTGMKRKYRLRKVEQKLAADLSTVA
jgi:ribosomal protein L2